MSRKYLPFDISIYDTPLLSRLSAFEYGLFSLLILDYWRCGIPLPERDYDLYKIGRTDSYKWSLHKQKVMEAVNEVMPILVKDMKNKLIRASQARKSALHMVDVRINRRIKKKAAISDDNTNHTQFSVISQPTVYHPGKHDSVERAKAIAAKSDDDTLFIDS